MLTVLFIISSNDKFIRYLALSLFSHSFSSLLCSRFGLESNSSPRDPRRRVSQQRMSDSPNYVHIPDDHPFIDRKIIKDQADDLFKNFLLWAERGGSKDHPFSPVHILQLACVLKRIGESRSHLRAGIVKVLMRILRNKGKQLNLKQRAEMVKEMNGFLHTIQSGNSVESSDLNGLQDAISFLQGLSREMKDEEEREEEDEELGQDDMDSINRSVGIAPEMPQLKKARKEEGLSSDNASSAGKLDPRLRAKQQTTTSSTTSSSIAIETAPKNETVLSSELGLFTQISSNTVQMLHMKAGKNPTITKGSKDNGAPRKVKTLTNASQFDFDSTIDLALLRNLSGEDYGAVAVASLKRLLESIHTWQQYGQALLLAHLKLALRTTLSMSNLQLQEGKELKEILVVATTPTNLEFDKSLLDGVPPSVSLPQPLWLYLSFFLGCDASTDSTLGVLMDPREYMIKELLIELYRRGGGRSPIYEHACLVVISRVIQRKPLRHLINAIFSALPEVPTSILSLLNLVAVSGSVKKREKGRAEKRQKGKMEEEDKGTRAVATQCIQLVAIGQDCVTAENALNHLLWCSVSEVFLFHLFYYKYLCGEYHKDNN